MTTPDRGASDEFRLDLCAEPQYQIHLGLGAGVEGAVEATGDGVLCQCVLGAEAIGRSTGFIAHIRRRQSIAGADEKLLIGHGCDPSALFRWFDELIARSVPTLEK